LSDLYIIIELFLFSAIVIYQGIWLGVYKCIHSVCAGRPLLQFHCVLHRWDSGLACHDSHSLTTRYMYGWTSYSSSRLVEVHGELLISVWGQIRIRKPILSRV